MSIPLSIITINFNNRLGLKKTIESIISQTFKEFEWIVIDGGSTDGGKELLEKYQQHFSYWVSEPDNGIYHAMNKGISHVHGEYVNFMNSGDIFYNDTTLEEFFNNQLTGDLVYGEWLESIGTDLIPQFTPKEVSLDYFFKGNICHQSAFIKSNIIKKYGFDEKYKIVADWQIWVKMLIDGYSMQYVNQTICIFDGNEGISSIKDDKLMKEKDRMLEDTIPPCYIAILNENYRMKKLLKDFDNCQLTAKDLSFLRWHPRYANLINHSINLASRIIKMFK